MVAGKAGFDFPGAEAALSVLPLGADVALTSRVRRETEKHLIISVPRDSWGNAVVLVTRDLLELSWQADDGLRSVQTEVIELTADNLWRVRLRGEASKIQRRDAVRAPIGWYVKLTWGGVIEITGSTVDLSEGGVLAVFRPHGDLETRVPMPKPGQHMELTLDLYSDVLVTPVELIGRRPREDDLNEWSLRFLGLPEKSADLIRSHVFTALRNARARGIAALY